MKLREGKMSKGGHNDLPTINRPEKPLPQGIKSNMINFICFYHQEYIMNHCVKIQALDYDDAETKFRKYLENEISYINDECLLIEDIDGIVMI